MKIQIMSDVHCNWENFPADPSAEGILIAGDITNRGTTHEWCAAQTWLNSLAEIVEGPIAFIGGNHDFFVKDFSENFVLADNVFWLREREEKTFGEFSIIGLNMSMCSDLPFLATQWTNLTARPEVDEAYYSNLPQVDIVVSHSPAYGALDLVKDRLIGSKSLEKYLTESPPRLFVCGHVHECTGEIMRGVSPFPKTKYINTAQKSRVISL
jgi:Icc-related predicted phosphoesterase